MGEAQTILRIAVAIIRDEAGRVLLVRKAGTRAFMQPGGKIEAGERPDAALCRELAEELRLQVSSADLRYIGEAEAPAANEPDTFVHAEIFEIAQCGPIVIAAEIAEAAWVDPDRPATIALAPLTRDHILPLVEQVHGMDLS
ncbi:NUDIX hydrolase [Alteriqipengyuania lutimaris]|uniref:NUDIX domain-containing protein n=1 Tax=Alteriqipengyuania lutimaris TaxID=1538146 RepID=A0A395LHL1_9SPHN|nr:NUDIX domain-containing protein [Alteriqipengyuania lutimaris]MBB3034792.1 8-oxo-dGTP pyrophosphatase MutT (NUDIX family) [Alteriqipengyuania lutimaris]RDS76363.1 NUDIX domain-containing protein [Alteriqipengyuania lutimaris]